MADNPLRVLALPSDYFGCGQWRIIQPYSAMADPRVTARVQIGGDVAGDTFDVAVFGRPLRSEHFELLAAIKSWGKKLVIDFDDPFPLTDPRHPEFELYSAVNVADLRAAIDLADAVTVATPQLVLHYQAMHGRVMCMPSAVDVRGPLYAPGRTARLSQKLTIFWSGWGSHEPNLRMIRPAISRLLSEREDAVLAICGLTKFVDLFREVIPAERVLYIEPAPFEAFMRTASVADVAIAPLELTEFNENKSEIRLIEAGAWSVPAVASPVAAYRRFEGGQNACLFAENPDEWHHELRRLLDDVTLRREIGAKARAAVESRYALADVNRARADLLCGL
jgi:glycosyltransferase involved in cell wall biosynthesis